MRFVVAKINFFDNVLTQEVKEYSDLDTAYASEMRNDGILDGNEFFVDIDEAKQRYFDCDQMISILEI